MPRDRTDIPDAELAVLKVLWDRSQATIREITDVLYPEGGASHYATVQKLLDRLRDRGLVDRNSSARAHVFSARVEREELIRHRLREAADKLCEGSMTPLLTQLVRGRRLDEGELRTLRELVSELDREPKGGAL